MEPVEVTRPVIVRLISLIALSLFGYLIGISHLLDPIHEAFHVMQAGYEGSNAQIVGWSWSRVDHISLRVLEAGYGGCILLGIVLAISGAIIGRNKKILPTGGFGLGYALATFVASLESYDFMNGLYDLMSREGVQDLRIQFPILRAKILDRWDAFFLFVFTISVLVVGACILFPGKKSRV
jgi:hypothetical protein